MSESFPRQEARTRRFTLGAPRAFRISPDGTRVVFLRSKGGTDPVTCLWTLDVRTGAERLVADPGELGADEANLPPQERARRERVREQAGGIVAYATDAAVTVATFALSGRVYAVGLTADALAKPQEVTTHTPALDPRPDPAGQRVAYVCDGALRVTGLDGKAWDRILADPHGHKDITYGLPEFIAGEEMGRHRGYWWAPDGSALLAARVDNSPVRRWYIADPANPDAAPAEVAYPAAGTPNASVSLLIVHVTGRQVAVDIDHAAFPYVATASWQRGHDPLVVVQSRDQRVMRLLTVDPATGRCELVREDTDPHWLEIVPGVPAWTASGRLVWTQDTAGTRRLLVATVGSLRDGTARPVTPPGLQVRDIADIDGDIVMFRASSASPTEIELWAYGPDGLMRLSSSEPGVHSGLRAGGTMLITRRTLDADGMAVSVHHDGRPTVGIESLAERPSLPAPRPVIFAAGERGIPTAVLFPSWHSPDGGARLPVLMDPYGGPQAQRVLAARGAYLEAQWFAEQGFAVVIADGRGTPGRDTQWERAVAGDLATPVLEDQIDALTAAASRFPALDTGRVAIRGWSFGGYLAALAVLSRPDMFHAAVAGAPVTDWRLYDTHYTERYLGLPEDGGYQRSSLINLVERTGVPRPRPLLLIHGLADDNVVVAHTLRLSAALLAAGYPHEVLPLTGITHMASTETVAENLLKLQLDFLRRSLELT
jgi:dipeptidyl-peptidase 4